MIHPHVPVGIPCYDLTPVIGPTFDGSLLAVRPPASGIINSEVAEQASHALLSRIADIDKLLIAWCESDNPLLAYCALLSAARNGRVEGANVVQAIVHAVNTFSDNRLVAQGATALAMQLSDEAVKNLLQNIPENPTAKVLREEIAWRVE